MFKGVKGDELDVVKYDGYANYPFIGESGHLKEVGLP